MNGKIKTLVFATSMLMVGSSFGAPCTTAECQNAVASAIAATLIVPTNGAGTGSADDPSGGGGSSVDLGKLVSEVGKLSKLLKEINITQYDSWNTYVKMQADAQFTGPSVPSGQPDLSQYPLLDASAYGLSRSFLGMQKWVDNLGLEQFKVVSGLLNPSCTATLSQRMVGLDTITPASSTQSGGSVPASDSCISDSFSGTPFVHEYSMLAADGLDIVSPSGGGVPALGFGGQHNVALDSSAQLLARFSTDKNLPPQVLQIAASVLSEIIAQRTPQVSIDPKTGRVSAAQAGPSMISALSQAVETLFSPEWENGLAQASQVDVLRAQTELLALGDYIQFQQLKTQQRQLELTIAMMAILDTKQ